jgi:hypothetical protein
LRLGRSTVLLLLLVRETIAAGLALLLARPSVPVGRVWRGSSLIRLLLLLRRLLLLRLRGLVRRIICEVVLLLLGRQRERRLEGGLIGLVGSRRGLSGDRWEVGGGGNAVRSGRLSWAEPTLLLLLLLSLLLVP